MEEKKDKTKTILLIIIVILLMSLTLFVGYYFGQKNNKQTDKDNTKVEEKTKENKEEEEKPEAKVEAKDYSKYSIVKEYSKKLEGKDILLIAYGEEKTLEDDMEETYYEMKIDAYADGKIIDTSEFYMYSDDDKDLSSFDVIGEEISLKKYNNNFYLLGFTVPALMDGIKHYIIFDNDAILYDHLAGAMGNVSITIYSNDWIDIKDKSIRYIDIEDYSSKTKEYTITFDGDNYKKTETGTYDLSDCGENDDRVEIAGQC